MTGPSRGRGERGTTLIEVMVAGVLILVAMLAFVGTMRNAADSTAVGHRRSMAALARTALMDRLTLTPRDRYGAMTLGTWLVDTCYDVSGQVTTQNSAGSATFSCASSDTYRTQVMVESAGTRQWAVHGCAERIGPGDSCCPGASRYTSLSCVAADVFLTD